MIKPVIFGNWKMNKTMSETIAFINDVESKFADIDLGAIMGIAVPYTQLASAVDKADKIQIAAQNVHHKTSGAFTGEISVGMLVDLGIKYCLTGHSERRTYFSETNEQINEKNKLLLANDIVPIFCFGETEDEYVDGQTEAVVATQLEKGLAGIDGADVRNIIFAYEPVWAIGTGKTATPEIAQNVVKFVRETIAKLVGEEVANVVAIQYGGSMNPGNIKELMSQNDINGGLVGGASLEVSSYLDLYNNMK